MKLLLVSGDLITAIKAHQSAFGLSLGDDTVEQLARYYDLVQEQNALLHLVAPCSAEEFAVRHILESLTLLEYLPKNTKFADVGTGAGLPSIPCLLVRDDLKATLIESKEKKTAFLEQAVKTLGLSARATVVNRQFDETDISECQYATARALDKFTERLPRLLKWVKGKRALLFGGENLGLALQKSRRPFVQKQMPLSEKRYLFVVED